MQTIVIAGRPNVGKSTLFNRLLGHNRSIVHDRPGVTRDCVFARMKLSDRQCTLVDTGGFVPGSHEVGMDLLVADKVQRAVEKASVIILVFDAREGLTPADSEVVEHLRHLNIPMVAVANKVDPGAKNHLANEIHRAGITPLVEVSAEHGLGMDALRDELAKLLPTDLTAALDDRKSGTSIAFLGRPNVGKSSLINRIIQEPRMIVSEHPGTTRDMIDIALTRGDRSFVLLDTAGLRRRFKVSDEVEKYSAARTLRAIDRAYVVVLVLDAQEELTTQDEKIASQVIAKGKGLLVVTNKWDLVKDHPNMRKRFREDVYSFAPFLRFAAVRFVSAQTGFSVDQILTDAWRIHQRSRRKFSQAELDAVFDAVSSGDGTGGRLGINLRTFGLTQSQEDTVPTFFLWCNDPRIVPPDLERYWHNTMGNALQLEGVPVRVVFRRRQKKRGEVLKTKSARRSSRK